ncbi:helix-turn-helix domain-containing protein [Rhodococcus sp. IEGM 1408]|uniref:PucR family transcriptional regulator n=1 Tax=Rhodococcus sp. IEGM 1408 TaxID=3082220 RepID=UPI002953BBE4|nr:helix-turn-helix domain-containing protein [Rhodococcus sp. IEGM 1408]MDV7999628.1 helix-turn-helix domain-containing protein [Rhodococcus sp. IEGM 1408]
MLSTSPQDPERLDELTRQIGLRLSTRTAAVSDGMTEAIEKAIGELDDEGMRAALHASVSNNVEVIIDLLSHTRPAHDLPPLPAATRYAVELARQDVSSAPLRRAYHVGSDALLAHVFDQVQEIDCEPHEKLQLYHHLAGWMFQYVDEITRTVIAAHEEEVRSSHNRAARSINASINRVLTGEAIDPDEFERVTGYQLNQVHLGCRVWIDDFGTVPDQARLLTDAVTLLAEELDLSHDPLMVVTGRATAEVWFGMDGRRSPVEAHIAAPVAAAIPGARIAFGAPSPGLEGFRVTRVQAEQAAAVAQVSTTGDARSVSYSDDGIPVIARLAEDLGTTRRWVHEVLGELACDTAHAARQRETVRVFLETADSYTETASRLLLHRNSVKYRLTKAESELGRPMKERRLDTQLALATCRVLGSVVLSPADDQPPA